MKSRGSRMEAGGCQTRNVLECGSSLPLSAGGARPVPTKGARGLAQSKTWRRFIALPGFIILHSSFCLRASGQTCSIDWSTIDSGGGTSTGGPRIGVNYSVRGTIGQPDVGGLLTNGQYSVTGGFWGLPAAVQTTNAPTLTIAPATPGDATISWTPNTPGFVLQETLSLSPTNWFNSACGSTNPITVQATLPARFYRLAKP